MSLFDRGSWITEEEFRKLFGYKESEIYPSHDVLKAIRYGCDRVNTESGSVIINALDGEPFPHGLTKLQADTVLEAAAYVADVFLTQGGAKWHRGSSSTSIGQSSASITGPDEPDYIQPFIRDKLYQVGLCNKVLVKDIPLPSEKIDPMFGYRDDPNKRYPLTKDEARLLYLAKRGSNGLVSKDKSVKIKDAGGVYDGIDISVNTEELDKEWSEKFYQFQGEIKEEVDAFEEKVGKWLADGGKDNTKGREKIEKEIVDKVKKIADKAQEALDKAEEAIKTANSVRKDADDGKFKGDKGDSGDYKVKDMSGGNSHILTPANRKNEIPSNGTGTLVSPTIRMDYQKYPKVKEGALCFGGDGVWVRDASLYLMGGDENGKVVYKNSQFKENEDLEDIIAQHRLNTTLIASMENTIKANKQRLVELYNDNLKLQNLVLDMKKDLDEVVTELSELKARKGGKLL